MRDSGGVRRSRQGKAWHGMEEKPEKVNVVESRANQFRWIVKCKIHRLVRYDKCKIRDATVESQSNARQSTSAVT